VPDAWRETLGERYLPGALVAPRPRPKTAGGGGSTDRLDMDEAPPIWADRDAVDGEPTAYVCEGARARRRRPTSTRRWSGWRRGADLSSDAGTSIVRAGGGTFYAPRFGGAIMERHDLLYRLYDEFDVETLREYQSLVDLFPPVDSRVALEHWEDAGEELARLKREIREALPAGATFAEVAAYADREAAFTALDLHARYDRAVNALVLDATRRSGPRAARTTRSPRDAPHAADGAARRRRADRYLHRSDAGECEGVHDPGARQRTRPPGRFSIVYEAGNGVFTAGHGSRTKCLLYEDLDEAVRGVFGAVRSRVLPDAPENVRRGCHLQGNEFNVTLKPNFETGGADAEAVIDDGLIHLIDLLGEVVVDRIAEDLDPSDFDTEGDATNADLADRGAAGRALITRRPTPRSER